MQSHNPQTCHSAPRLRIKRGLEFRHREHGACVVRRHLEFGRYEVLSAGGIQVVAGAVIRESLSGKPLSVKP